MYGRKNTENMLRKVNDMIGMTFEQKLSTLTLLGVIIATWINFNIKVENHDVRIKTLEEGKTTNSQNIKELRTEMTEVIGNLRKENREDFQKITDKLDEIIKGDRK